MEFTINKKDLLEELNLTEGVVAERTTIPILGHLLIEAAGGLISIAATDLELAVRTSVAAAVATPGAATVPGRKLRDLVRLWPEDVVTFKSGDGNSITMSSGRRKYKMGSLDPSSYPRIPEAPKPLARVPVAVFATLVDRVALAIAEGESRYTLAGALMVFGKDSIMMVATDGHRMALCEREGSFAALGEQLVPKNVLPEIKKLATEGEIEFGRDDSHLYFAAGRRTLIARQLTGQFPNYGAVMPKENDKKAKMKNEDLRDAVVRLLQMADRSAARFEFGLPGGVRITASSAAQGEAEEFVEAAYEGEPLTVGFNGDYVLDFLRVSPGDFTMAMKTAASACEMRSVDPASKYTYILMPMAVPK